MAVYDSLPPEATSANGMTKRQKAAKKLTKRRIASQKQPPMDHPMGPRSGPMMYADEPVTKRQKAAMAPSKRQTKQMSELTTKARKALKKSQFAVPGKRAYPINDESHARNALARVAQHGTPEEKSKVKAAVSRKFPNIGKSTAKKAAPKKK